MMSKLCVAATLAVGFFSAVLRAGVYNPAEQPELPILVRPITKNNTKPSAKQLMAAKYQNFLNFRQFLDKLRKMPVENSKLPPGDRIQKLESQERLRAVLAASIDPKKVPAHWNLAQRLSLSAYYIRCGKFREARELLEQSRSADPKNFLVLANLAVANFQDMDKAGARQRLKDAIKYWPDWTMLEKDKETMAVALKLGWHADLLDYYKEREKYCLTLFEKRLIAEKKKVPMKNEVPDDLFGDLSFVGDKGEFEPGKLAAKERKKLPKGNVDEAIDIVKYLLLWLPSDPRLYWLFGELYNAGGGEWDMLAANTVFEDLAGYDSPYGHYRPRQLLDHREVLTEHLKNNPPEDHESHLNPVLGLDEIPKPNDGKDAADTPFDMKTLGIGFAAGAVVMLFVFWQIREIRRRRQNRSGPHATTASPGGAAASAAIREGSPPP
jgi:tetratricopeptide (TPR) repeat protein